MQRKISTLILVFTLLLAAGSIAYAQLGGAGWNEFEGNLRVWNDFHVRGDTDFDGDVTLGTDLTVDEYLRLVPKSTPIAVTNDSTITPTGGLQYLTSLANRGTRLVVTGTVSAGTLQTFYNSGSFTITLTDTAPLLLAGNWAGGPHDNLTLFHNGTNWVEMSRGDVHHPVD